MNEKGGPGDFFRPPSFGRPGPRMVAWLATGALVVILVGIAGGRDRGDKFDSANKASLPECANVTQVVERPASVPSNLLPTGTTLTSRMSLPESKMLVTGVVPFDFRTAVQFFVTKVPEAGYRLGKGAAGKGEAEAVFVGKNISGKWKVNGIPGCPDAVTLTLFVSRG